MDVWRDLSVLCVAAALIWLEQRVNRIERRVERRLTTLERRTTEAETALGLEIDLRRALERQVRAMRDDGR